MSRRFRWLLCFAMFSLSCFTTPAVAQWPSSGKFLNEGAYSNRRAQHAVSDGRNGMIVAWEVEYGSNDAGIYAARVDGAGNVSWTVELTYNPARATDPDIAPDGFGGAFVVWSEYVSATDYDIKLNRVSRTGSVGYGLPANVCAAAGAQVAPRLAAVSTNNVIIAWQDQRTNSDIYAQRWTTGGNMWAANGIPICTATGLQWTPQVAADGSGGAIIAWDDGRTTFEPYGQRVNASGTTLWTGNGVNLCGGATGTQWLAGVVSDGSGGGIFGWIDERWYNISGWDVYAQRVNGAGALQWGANGTVVTNAGGDQDAVSMAGSGNGAAWFVWDDKRNGSQGDIYMDNISSAGGGAPNDYAVCTATGAQINGQCSADPFGKVLISWTDYRNGNGDVYVQKMAFLADWIADGVQVTSSGTQSSPAIVTDQAQGALVAWLEDVGGTDEVFAGRVTAAGVANPATYFQSDGYAISTGGGVLGQPVTLSDGSGGFFATWADTKTGAGDIYLQHYNGAGFVDGYWPATPYNLSSNASLQDKPAIAAGANWVIVAWEDSRSGNKDIYAHWVNRIDGGLYGGGVTAVCTATGDQTLPSVASDATSENFFLAWTDARNGTSNLDIYATRMRSNLLSPLTPNGVAIATAGGNQSDAKVIWDNVSGLSSAGAIIAWRGTGIYGQRMNNAGSLLWTSGGVTIESATAAAGPTMTPDASGGAMVEFTKGSPAAVYARRVDANGGFPTGWSSSVLFGPATQSTDVTMVQDGPGNSLICWLEQVGATYTVRVNRIGIGGGVASGWPSDGRAVRSSATVAKPSVCRDGIGGAIVAWQENNNIYVSRVVYKGWLDPNYGASGVVLCGASGTQDLPSAVFLATGSAAVVWRDSRNFTNADVFAGKTTYDVTPPATILYVTATGGCEQIHVGWVAPADDGNQTVLGYELAGWPMLHIVPTGTPQSPGSWEEYIDQAGFCAVNWYYTLTSWDECGNMAYATTSNTASTWCGPPWNCMDLSGDMPIVALAPGLAPPEPNPARDRVKLKYVVPGDHVGQPLELAAYDLLGRRVATVKRETARPGEVQLDWDLRGESGVRLSGGVYFLRLTIGSVKFERRLIMAR